MRQARTPNHTLQRTGRAARRAAVCRPLSSCSLGGLVHLPLDVAKRFPWPRTHIPGLLNALSGFVAGVLPFLDRMASRCRQRNALLAHSAAFSASLTARGGVLRYVGPPNYTLQRTGTGA